MSTFASTAGFTLSHLGSTVTLTTSNPSCFGDDIDVLLDDEASVDVSTVCSANPAIGGIARPVGSLSDFDTAGQAGTWTLNYSNNFFGCGPAPCTGTLNEWCVTTSVAIEAIVDTDGDGVADDADNCTLVANAAQRDTDGDSIGNICDPDIAVPNDCAVNFLDLNAMKAAFFSTPAAPNWNPDADLNGDDSVNFADLQVVKDSFFGTPGPSGLPNPCDCT